MLFVFNWFTVPVYNLLLIPLLRCFSVFQRKKQFRLIWIVDMDMGVHNIILYEGAFFELMLGMTSCFMDSKAIIINYVHVVLHAINSSLLSFITHKIYTQVRILL